MNDFIQKLGWFFDLLGMCLLGFITGYTVLYNITLGFVGKPIPTTETLAKFTLALVILLLGRIMQKL